MTFNVKWTRWLTGAFALAVVAVLSAAAIHAQQGPGRGRHDRMFGPGHGGPFRAAALGLRQLDLTDAQRDQVKGIFQQHRDEFRALATRGLAAREALDAAVTAAAPDEAAIRQASAGVAQVQADAAVLRAKVRSEVFGVLTAEQRQKADQLRNQMKQRMQERLQRHLNDHPDAGPANPAGL